MLWIDGQSEDYGGFGDLGEVDFFFRTAVEDDVDADGFIVACGFG